MLVFRVGIHKLLVRIANREDPDLKKKSDLGLLCLSLPFWQATSVPNFRTFTVGSDRQKIREQKILSINFNICFGCAKNVSLRRFFCFVCMFDLIPSTIFQLNRDGSPWVEPVLS